MQDDTTHKLSVAMQTVALVIAAVAIVWGLAMAYVVAFPGPSGEWAAMGIFLASIFNIPAGIISLVIALTVKHGSAKLRRLCVILSLIALLLPLLPDGIHRYMTRWKYHVVGYSSSGSIFQYNLIKGNSYDSSRTI
jgi:hypothetical protein